ncbi:MAG: phosphatidylinositol-specific phospholipase C/glycerophosphodiester phosphodiesterase family protein [Pseudomonadota bacterium]
MELIAHRRNTPDALDATPRHLGVEVDIRSQGDRLVIHHDPFEAGEDFEAWLAGYQHGTLILNVKEEGLETACLDRMRRAGIEHFFFLDQSFPFLMRTARMGERRCAVRVSEYESVETALSLAGQVDWVWVDCFTRLALARKDHDRLRAAGFRLCLVSPELQGRDASTEIPELVAQTARHGLRFDAVCTKRDDLWETHI